MQTDASAAVAGYEPPQIRTGEPTRWARLKWVVVVEETLPAGRAVNAAVCVAAATGASGAGLLRPDAKDAAGDCHPGLLWAGSSSWPPRRRSLPRSGARPSPRVCVADMPSVAQTTRVYDEYLERVSTTDTDQLSCYAVSVIGPRNTSDKMVRELALLG